MNWTTASDLRRQVDKLWERGELLAALAGAELAFPRRLVLKSPSAAEITTRFEDVRAWAAGLRDVAHCRIETRTVAHRIFGSNSLPQEAWLDSVDDALALIGKQRDGARFSRMLQTTHEQCPELRIWLTRKPLRALDLADSWTALLAVVAWLKANPHSGIYIRQVDIAGIDSKFIEAHRGILSELLDLALAPEAIDSSCSGATQFARRYGFRDKPQRVRFRMLDPAIAILPGHGAADLSLDAASFAALAPPVRRVFVTENEVNYLAFPFAQDSMIIFGAGYGWEVLANAAWLQKIPLHYWGDIDTHGFAILNSLRARFSHVESMLMDHASLMAHEHAWGREDKPIKHELPLLAPGEQLTYDCLRHDVIRPKLRLEQEKLGFRWLKERLQCVINA